MNNRELDYNDYQPAIAYRRMGMSRDILLLKCTYIVRVEDLPSLVSFIKVASLTTCRVYKAG